MMAVSSAPTHPCPRCGKVDWYETTETRPQKGWGFTISHQTFYVWSCRGCGEKLLDQKVERLKKPIKGLKYYGIYLMGASGLWIVLIFVSTKAYDEVFFAIPLLAAGFLMFNRGRANNARQR